MYFLTYKNIEREVLRLSSVVHFSDEHMDVFSIDIAYLIVKCSLELESIAKDIYRKEMKRAPEKTGDCFTELDRRLEISKKEISFISPYFYFEKELMPSFRPFDYEKGSPEDFYSQYNSIKHDKVKNIRKGNLRTLLRILGALYVLNLYYEDKIFALNDCFGHSMDYSYGSDVFEYRVMPCKEDILQYAHQQYDLDSCIYRIIQEPVRYSALIQYINSSGILQCGDIYSANNRFQEYLEKNKGGVISAEAFFKNFEVISGLEEGEARREIIDNLRCSNIISITVKDEKPTYKAILNKPMMIG